MQQRGGRGLVATLIIGLIAAACSAPAPAAPPTVAPAPTTPATNPAASPASSAAGGPAASPSVSASPAAGASPVAAAPITVPTLQAGPAQHVTAIWVARASNMAPAWIALDAGYFAEQGLDVDLSYVNGSPAGMAALLSGDQNFLEAAGTAAVTAGSQATSDTSRPVMFIGTVNHSVTKLMVRADITSPDQIPGKTLCVTGPGTLDDVALRLYLARRNLDPTKDVSIISGGSIDGCVAAVTAGEMDGVAASTPATALLAEQGFNTLVDFGAQGIELQQLGVSVTAAYLQTHRDTVVRFTRAYIQAIHRFKTDKAFAEQELSKYLNTDDQGQLDDSFTTYVSIFEQVPVVTDAALQNEIDTTPSAAGKTPDDFRDNSIVQELQQNGFIQSVYGQ